MAKVVVKEKEERLIIESTKDSVEIEKFVHGTGTANQTQGILNTAGIDLVLLGLNGGAYKSI